MSAGNIALLCERGHRFADLHLDDYTVYGNRLLPDCPCRSRIVLEIPHYGDINDCRGFDQESEFGIQLRLTMVGYEPIRTMVPIASAVDRLGHKIEAFYAGFVTLPTYDLRDIDLDLDIHRSRPYSERPAVIV